VSKATVRSENAANPSNVEHLHGGGVGALLKASRIRTDEEVEDIASILRISRRYIEAIEEGRFDVLPGRTYAIGFVRAYADHIGLDSDEVVRRFKLESEDSQRGPDLHFPEPIPESKVPGAAIVMIGALLAAAAYGGWYFSTGRDEPPLEAVAPVPETTSTVTESAVVVPEATEEATTEEAIATDAPEAAVAEESDLDPVETPVADAETAVEETVNEAEAATTAAVDETMTSTAPDAAAEVEAAAETPQTTAEPEPVTAAAEAAAPTVTVADAPLAVAEPIEAPAVEANGESANAATTETEATVASIPTPEPKPAAPAADVSGIQLTATASSWVQIRDETSGDTLVTQVMRVGDTVRVPDQPNLTLITGNAGGLTITVDGVTAPSIGAPGDIVRNVVLDGERLLAGTATP